MDLNKIVVIGSGTMGRGIAQWFVQAGCQVELSDHSRDQLNQAKTMIHESWEKLTVKGKFTEDQSIEFRKNLIIHDSDSLDNDADLVIEAIFEDLEIKKKLFNELDKKFSSKTYFASNTSSFPLKEMGADLPEHRQRKFLGLHFFNPATIMKLVEIIQSPWITEDELDSFKTWFQNKGKVGAICKDSPGFIVNRVARNFYGEALRIVQEDNQKKYLEIDKVMREVGGFKMGPFELMDLIGIDINYAVTQSVWQAFGENARFAPHPLQKSMVEQKRLGKKTKRGFYEHE